MIHLNPYFDLIGFELDDLPWSPSAATAFRYGGRRIGVQRREAEIDQLKNSWNYLL